MKVFQTVVIFSNNITEDILDKEISRYEMLLQSFSKTKKVRTSKLGERAIAYKTETGKFVVFTFEAENIDKNYFIAKLQENPLVIKYSFKYAPDSNLEPIISEQTPHPDAYDVLFGLDNYKNK